MKKKRSIFSVLWITFWVIVPAALSLFIVFNLRAGLLSDYSDPTTPSGKLYYSFRDADLEPRPGQWLVVYDGNEKSIVKVAYTDIQESQFGVVDADGKLQIWSFDSIWGEVSIL